MPIEMQIVMDFCEFLTVLHGRPTLAHFGDKILRKEIEDEIAANGIARWLVPEMNDKGDELANATENTVQTFRGDLVIVADKASDCVKENLALLGLVYLSAEGIVGKNAAPVEWDGTGQAIGKMDVYRFEPVGDEIVLAAREWDGKFVVEQPVIISAEKIP